ncbi:MAG: hypothetical protein PHQ55_08585 [Eubacteriales bacterium]|nr:hypothetical protein [Eubacteriales bacterium]MDD3198364.1 hypothetical protein [Eubacteriales bacterium]MDD3504005.1 hypothetical protein [Eubacteriales bacterium]MDD4683210.1 hypothetical protein [Eubacteriales bacterium]
MKKFISILTTAVIIAAVSLSTVACGNNKTAANSKLEGSLEDILKQVYEEAELSDEFRTWTESGLLTNDITAENEEYHLGKTGIEYEEGIISEPMMMPSAYALCLIRAGEDQDIEALKTEISENANPNKWICVGVDEKNVLVDNVGDVVMLVMSDDNAQTLMDSFKGLAG